MAFSGPSQCNPRPLRAVPVRRLTRSGRQSALDSAARTLRGRRFLQASKAPRFILTSVAETQSMKAMHELFAIANGIEAAQKISVRGFAAPVAFL
jgi:hypothetical protein